MPAKISRTDAPQANLGPQTDQEDAGTKAAASKTQSKVTAPMAANAVMSMAAHGGDMRIPSANLSRSDSHSGEQSTSLGFLQTISESNAARRPGELSIWDFDTPIESVGESPSFEYEPQGELIEEQREQQPLRSEFSIPQAVSGSGINWTFPASETGPSNDAIAVPARPSEVPASVAGNKRKSTADPESVGTRVEPEQKRSTRVMQDSSKDTELASPSDIRPSALYTRSHSGPSTRLRSATDTAESRSGLSADETEIAAPPNVPRRTSTDPAVRMVLPARKVFPIQIGDKLFRLSGASISSDAPSYFSHFFEEQLRQNDGADKVRTLYIDRDPATFEEICLHLQGYHIEPRDGPHFVKLFADAQFFSLPRLTAQLFTSPIYIRIGDEEFQIPRDLFSNPGDSPNYFSLGFAIFFTTPREAFPGLSQRKLLRPPSILPPSIPNRSAKTFADLLHILKGYPVEIRNEEHRAELLRDARYFHLKGLEQRLIPHQISYNLARKKSEILLRLEDIRQSGISVVTDSSGQSSTVTSPASSTTSSTPTGPGWVFYQRPYIDSEPYSLIVEIDGEESSFLSIASGLAVSPARVGRATFNRQTLSRVTSLFSVIANKMNLPIMQPLGLMMMERGAGVASLPVSPGNTGLSDERVKVRIGPDADVRVDGKQWLVGEEDDDDDEESEMDVGHSESSRSNKKQKRSGGERKEALEWVVQKAQWRLRFQPVTSGAQAGKSGMEIILGAVKIEAYSNERARNTARAFLV